MQTAKLTTANIVLDNYTMTQLCYVTQNEETFLYVLSTSGSG